MSRLAKGVQSAALVTIGKCRSIEAEIQKLADRSNIRRLSQIDATLVHRYRSERAQGGPGRKAAKPKTIHNDTVTIGQLVNFALKRRMISDAPLKDLEIKKPKRTPQPCWARKQYDGPRSPVASS